MVRGRTIQKWQNFEKIENFPNESRGILFFSCIMWTTIGATCEGILMDLAAVWIAEKSIRSRPGRGPIPVFDILKICFVLFSGAHYDKN